MSVVFFTFILLNKMDQDRLPWKGIKVIKGFKVYNEHFKIIKIIDDRLTHLKYEVKCIHCIRSKSLTADTRSPSNLKKHLTVSINYLF